MKKKLGQIRKLLLLTLLGVTLVMPVTAQAADYNYTLGKGELCATVKESGSGIPEGNEYRVILTAEAGMPMPDGSVMVTDEDGTEKLVKEITVKAGETADFQGIYYNAPGEYHYTIHQEAEPRNNFTYDTTVYNVGVWIVNDGNDGLKAMIFGYRSDSTEKAEQFLFQNHYSRPANPSNPSDDGGNGGGSGDSTPTVVQTVVTPAVPAPPAQVVLPPASQTGTGPQTGDESNVMLWAAGALLGAAVLIISAFLGKKNNKADKA
ncbi:MAG TPA: LPXTG cell wall anchor domain-containing protein [Candidatus Eisenbergiella merdipullorum]|uniref:LPXTG cell wall anchor domain-containing protein n=1 Tax=Candidatus Eisenbergiella merdipullorum TaxID=2838553 RepID=A0A9D2I5R6_9FIRM|nr:LPXTG cell wall anchor domain-containing protein [Candidatus Eisenbergiella merdipullorum]